MNDSSLNPTSISVNIRKRVDKLHLAAKYYMQVINLLIRPGTHRLISYFGENTPMTRGVLYADWCSSVGVIWSGSKVVEVVKHLHRLFAHMYVLTSLHLKCTLHTCRNGGSSNHLTRIYIDDPNFTCCWHRPFCPSSPSSPSIHLHRLDLYII